MPAAENRDNQARPRDAAIVALACICTALAGCHRGNSDAGQPERSPVRKLRDAEANRLERTEEGQDGAAPVPRLFVNGDVIEIEDVLRPIRVELAEAARTLPPARHRELVHRSIIDEFRREVRSVLLYQQAAKRLSEREEEFINGLVDDAVRRRVNTEFAGRQTRYEKALNEQGLTAAEDRETIRREMVTMRYLHQAIMQRVLDPTRAELVRFFEEQQGDLSKPERRKMSLIEMPGTSPDARADIARAKAKLDGPMSFAVVATAHSKGIHAAEGGAWDWLTQGSVREHWEPAVDALFQLAEGDVSPIIETDEAFFIVRCDAIDPAVEPDFEAIQPRLMQAYRDLQFNRLVDERVRELQQNAVFVPENVGRFLQAVADAAPKPRGS